MAFMDGAGIALPMTSRSAMPMSTGHFFGLHSQQQQQHWVAVFGWGLSFCFIIVVPFQPSRRGNDGMDARNLRVI